ncbi:MAG: PDZ domain-containing protein [Pontiellaceae bacterium]|nr:PDZ domain-containing protein [Pontiellaceae bacterium]
MEAIVKHIVLAGTIMLAAGCSSTKPTLERGWVGGEYRNASSSIMKWAGNNYFHSNQGVIPALPPEIMQGQSSALFVCRVFENTPLDRAGIKQGDLVWAINENTVADLKDFRERIDTATPGETLLFSVYRDGETLELPVVVGRENYQNWHSISLGLQMGTSLDLIPNPDFDLFKLVQFQRNPTRLELQSPEYRFFAGAMSEDRSRSEPGLSNVADAEDWRAWLGIVGVSGNKVVLEQETIQDNFAD